MGKLSLEALLRLATPWLKWFDKYTPTTLEDFISAVEMKKGKAIIYGPTDLLKPMTAGVSVFRNNKYFIGIDQSLPEHLYTHTLLHELVHILKGDIDGDQASKLVYRGGEVTCTAENELASNNNEELVEYLAECFAERLRLQNKTTLDETMQSWYTGKGHK